MVRAVSNRLTAWSVAAIFAASLPAVLTFVVGCGSPASLGSSPEARAEYEKRVGSDEGKAKQFVSDLAAQPFDSRAAYLNAHPEQVRNLAQVPNPDLQTQFRKLMTNH